MNFDMYVVSQHKKGNKVVGFRVLAIKPDDSIETRDEEYNKVYAVAQKGLIKNLKVEGGKLKGVNGSLDRYATFGKNQALVILKELHDKNGNSLGYLCSDAEGRTRNLTSDDVLKFADVFSIANGKVVNDTTNNKRYISSIEGSYDIKTIQPTQQVKQQQPVQQQPQNNQQQTQKQSLPAISKEDLELINKVKNNANFSGSFAEKVVKTIEEKNFCSFNQRKALLKELHNWENPSEKSGLTDEINNVISELKKCKGYKDSYAKRIVDTVLRRKECTQKQLDYMKKELAKLQSEDTKLKEQNDNNNSYAGNNIQNKETTQSAADSNNQNQETTQDNSEETKKKEQEAKNKLEDKKAIDNAKRRLEEENKKVADMSEEDLIKLRQKTMSAKEKRAIDQTIMSDDIFDYSLHKNGTAFIEGFKKGIEVPEHVVTPETVSINNKTYKVIGISKDAFAAERIKTFKASKNISDIGQSCFENCSKLESLDLSLAQHTLIPARMCKDCVRLKEVSLGYYVEKIHEFAFYNTGITSIKLPLYAMNVSQYAFAYCAYLKEVEGQIKVIDANAFTNCYNLSKFNFESINRVSTHAFRRCGFENLTIYKDTRVLGSKAFADNMKLDTVVIQEGIEEIGEYCFAKPKLNGKLDSGELPISNIDAPKSLKQIGFGAFRHALQVTGYTGTQAESHCISNGVPFNALDSVNDENSSTSRLTSMLIGNNPIETLKGTLENKQPGASNPDYDFHKDKLMNVPLNDATLSTLGFAKCENHVDPHIKFKGAVNYLQDVSKDMKLPLMSSVLRLQKAFYVNNEAIYDDGCNKISKISYEMIDTLEKGEFIIVVMDNNLAYITDCNVYTDITMSSDLNTDDRLPLEQYLHVGDIIGDVSTISGSSGVLSGTHENIGTKLYDSIMRNCFSVKISSKDRYIYVPCEDLAMKLHDRTLDDIDENNKIKGSSEAILKLMDYNKFISAIKADKKQIGGSEKFFEKISNMSETSVNRKINEITNIGIEKEAQLFRVSKQFVDIVLKSGSVPNPNMLTIQIFNELANSYWMIKKDENWLRLTGKKSLNQTAEYHIGDCKLTEYKSNQIVKFSNPYMNGKKGAYVYVLTKNNTVLGVYASRYNMHWITEKLFALTYIPSGTDISKPIMTDPERFDAVSPDLFYQFYSILESKAGHSFSKVFMASNSYSNDFNISMYKPTGVFYITTNRFISSKTKEGDTKRIFSTIPILPIGDMNHALLVATTTNSNIRNNKRLQNLLDELTNLSAQIYKYEVEARQSRLYLRSDIAAKLMNTYDRYIEARRLCIQGITDASQYRNLVDDRIVFMMGAVHKGQLLRETDSTGFDEDNMDIIELDTSSEEVEIDIDENDNIQDDIDDIEIEESDETFDLDEEDNDIDNGISFDEFFETAKSMGITDEDQARVMYMNFLNSQQ